MRRIIYYSRIFFWHILGIDYKTLLKKTDYILLPYDKYTEKGYGTYDNGAKVWRWTSAKLEIGKYCSIAHGVNFIVDGGFHNCSEITNYPFINNLTSDPKLTSMRTTFQQKESIQIGNDVWIGMNSIILPGVKIGNGVTIAAGSVVNRDIPDYSIAGGVPAKVIMRKHPDDVIEKLLSMAWWNWDSEIIKNRKKDFYLGVNDFINKYYEN